MTELLNAEIGGERCLAALFANDPDAYIRGLNHGDVVAAITYAADRFLVCSRISFAISAFCVGEHRHATTVGSKTDRDMNSVRKWVSRSESDSPSISRQASVLDRRKSRWSCALSFRFSFAMVWMYCASGNQLRADCHATSRLDLVSC